MLSPLSTTQTGVTFGFFKKNANSPLILRLKTLSCVYFTPKKMVVSKILLNFAV
jgi:hypothetical protein